MKKKRVSDRILALSFPSEKELTLTLFRMAEFYESDSPKIRGKNFTFDEFVDHYADKKGNLDYFSYA